MNELIQRFVLEHMYTREMVFQQQLEQLTEQEQQEIKQHDFTNGYNRLLLGWKLQAVIEKTMVEKGYYDNDALLAKEATKRWNEQEAIIFSEATVAWYSLRVFKSVRQRKAFGALCCANMAGYQQQMDESGVFAQLVVRHLFTYEKIPVRVVESVFSWFYNSYYADDAQEAYKLAMKRLRLLDLRSRNRGAVLAKKAGTQGGVSRAVQAPFIEGFEKLYIEQLNKAGQQAPQFIRQFVAEYIDVTLQAAEQVLEEQPTEKTKHSEIDGIIEQLEQLKQTMQQQAPVEKQTSHTEQMQLAEEEIMRLRQTIEARNKELQAVRQQTYTQLIEQLGGLRSNYLLSDLYSESIGESTLSRALIQGQLLNFFNVLNEEMLLEPVSNGYELGEEFECTRGELARQFNVVGMVDEGEHIAVKLVKYGWSVNGQTIILPQVAQSKGVY